MREIVSQVPERCVLKYLDGKIEITTIDCIFQTLNLIYVESKAFLYLAGGKVEYFYLSEVTEKAHIFKEIKVN